METLSAADLESVVRYTEKTSSRVRSTYANIAETVNDLEMKWEELRESVKFVEMMMLQPEPSIAYL